MNKSPILNASQVWTPTGAIFNIGEQQVKETNLLKIGEFDPVIEKFHRDGRIHIHDLESYELTYNCLTVDWTNSFINSVKEKDITTIISDMFGYLTLMIQELGNDQSGGISFGNFDIEISDVLKHFGATSLEKHNEKILKSCIKTLILFCNNNKTRQGQVSYYVTFNIGLGSDPISRLVSRHLIEGFYDLGINIYKPNIVFKVNQKINQFPGTPNYDLFQSANYVSSKKMIPTYLLTSAKHNVELNPYELTIVGCRSRIYDNKHGNDGAIGGFNITSTSINLPRIALNSKNEKEFFEELTLVLDVVKKQLLHRFNSLSSMDFHTFNTWKKYSLYKVDINKVKSIEDFLLQGTLAFGYIGLYEVALLITGEETHVSDKANDFAFKVLAFIKDYVDKTNENEKQNFSLLSTAGELISGKFCRKDSETMYNPLIHDKGYYTNSFHMKVNSGLSVEEKIQKEGKFHELSSGGSITYVEATGTYGPGPEHIEESVNIASEYGVHYLGFNFPIDICSKCFDHGVFDECRTCGSNDIIRLRRVSGYIEDRRTFTDGKINEEKERSENEFKK